MVLVWAAVLVFKIHLRNLYPKTNTCTLFVVLTWCFFWTFMSTVSLLYY